MKETMKTIPIISPKQADFLLKRPKRLNILTGSVSSGKTWISLVGWALFVAGSPENYEFIMCGKTVTSLKRNCLNLLAEQAGENFTFSESAKSGMLYGRRVWLEGANDERSEGKIRGMTVAGAYCDELTLFPESFYMMLLSRLRKPGAKLFATSNPDSPDHWVKRKILDNEELQGQLNKWHFTLDDNDYNPPEFVDSLKREYTGVFYDRFVLGLWVRAEGLVYPMFDASVHVAECMPEECDRFAISMDYGIQNPTAMLLWGFNNGVWHCLSEFYHSGRDSGQMTDHEYYSALEKLAGGNIIDRVIVDPSAASFIALVRRNQKFRAVPADNSVVDGIRNCCSALSRGLVRINPSCKNFIREIQSYSWDEKSPDERPLKQNDHACDAFRYFVRTMKIALPVRE